MGSFTFNFKAAFQKFPFKNRKTTFCTVHVKDVVQGNNPSIVLHLLRSNMPLQSVFTLHFLCNVLFSKIWFVIRYCLVKQCHNNQLPITQCMGKSIFLQLSSSEKIFSNQLHNSQIANSSAWSRGSYQCSYELALKKLQRKIIKGAFISFSFEAVQNLLIDI